MTTRAVYVAPPTCSLTDVCPSTTWALVSTWSGRTKKPVPRESPAAIDATAGSTVLTTSSSDDGPAGGMAAGTPAGAVVGASAAGRGPAATPPAGGISVPTTGAGAADGEG
jgi:hypothetical protein